MRCPFCAALETKVVDSRLNPEGDKVRRRRECVQCGARFTSFETAELSMPRIIKSNAVREHFMEEKVRAGMYRALEKRPIGEAQIESAISRIKQQLQVSGEREVPARTVGQLVMAELCALDHVAYIRFASVYLSFADASAFLELIDKLEPQQKS